MGRRRKDYNVTDEPIKATPELAAQIVQVLKSSPELMAEVLQSAVRDSPELRALLGVSGKKHPDAKRNTASARYTMQTLGEATHEPGFTPVPPDHIVKAGPHAVEIWKDAWRRGKHIPRDETFDRMDQEAVAATAKG